jgi:hypothetical protein
MQVFLAKSSNDKTRIVYNLIGIVLSTIATGTATTVWGERLSSALPHHVEFKK